MRRIGVLLALVVAATGAAIYLSARGSAPKAFAITLTAQESPNLPRLKRHWTTTRRILLTCGTRPSATGSAASSASGRALCNAVAYYSRHAPTQRCLVIGPIVNYRRVVITGLLDGHPLHLTMGLVCNPPPALSRAVQTIYVAAFNPGSVHHASATTVRVPSVIGWGLPIARKILRSDHLRTPTGKCHLRLGDGGVIKQWPRQGTVVRVGTMVNLRIVQMHSSGVAAPSGGWATCDVTGLGR
jgi:hypothetical protein